MKTIIVTGVPGTGKTTFAKKLGKYLDYPVLDVKKFIDIKKIYSDYDRSKKCKIIDIKELNKELINEIKNVKKNIKPFGIIIDSHLSHYLPNRYVDLCVVTKCDLKILKKRLEKRGYGKSKVRENLDCEIFDICFNAAKENKHNIFVIDTTKRLNIDEISKKIRGELK